MTAPTHVPQFELKQKLALTINRYELLTPDGQLLGLAEQKRMALKEQVTFYSDAAKTQVLMSFKARKVVDLGSGYDVWDGAGQQIGFFKKDFGASLMRSTFHVEGPGYQGTGQERSQAVAIIRRFTELPFLPIHFDFVSAEGTPLISIERQATVRDRYAVTVPDQRVDFRMAAALAVGMDALMGR
jgi:uncharacterized protein YxjI